MGLWGNCVNDQEWAWAGSKVIPEVQVRQRPWRSVCFEDSTSIYTLFLTKNKHVSQCPPHELLQQSLMSRRKEKDKTPQDVAVSVTSSRLRGGRKSAAGVFSAAQQAWSPEADVLPAGALASQVRQYPTPPLPKFGGTSSWRISKNSP